MKKLQNDCFRPFYMIDISFFRFILKNGQTISSRSSLPETIKLKNSR